jgi:hypothetical protein
MDSSTEEIRKSIEKIHERLDEVSPVDFDCEKLCGEICCVFDSEEYPNDDLALFLMPGEELMYEDSEEFELYYIDAKELDFPHYWKGDVCLVKCINPPRCDRSIRPIQCRTFPLVPHISKNGEFHLVLDASEFPYECPLIENHIDFRKDFLTETFEVWKMLIRNPLVYDFVDMDSRRRENRKIDFEIVI